MADRTVPNKVRITSADEKRWRCSSPDLEIWRKPCGCLSATQCRKCGREDIYPHDHHNPICRHAS